MRSRSDGGEASWVVTDLHEVLQLGVAHGGHLLTAGERVVVDRMLALNGDEAVLYARLTARVPPVFEVDRLQVPGVADLPAAVAGLLARDLLDRLVPGRVRAWHRPVRELAKLARRYGMSAGGPKPALVARLAPILSRDARALGTSWVRVRYRPLIDTLARFAYLRGTPDRSARVVERLGVVRWPEYSLTEGTPLFWDRRRFLRWDHHRRHHVEASAEELLQALATGDAEGPAGLDLRPTLEKQLLARARSLERTDVEAAVALYRRLHADARVSLPRVAFRWARALEAAGRAPEAMALLRRACREATPVDRLQIDRPARRLARRLRRSWAPAPPLRTCPERALRLVPGCPKGPRPGWRPEPDAPTRGIEAAVVALLATYERRALHSEGRLWRTLFALLFAEAYFLDVPGTLPVPLLSGPLDLGTPSFAARRPAAVAEVLDAVSGGAGPSRILEAHARWHGVRLAGARWDLADADTLASTAEGIGPRGLRTVLEALLRGRRHARGLPDLVVLPGAPVGVAEAIPHKLGPGLVLAEVKGPSDSLRDAQRVWIHRLRQAGVSVEVWSVRPAG